MGTWHILTSSYPPHRGGIGFHSHRLARGLLDAGRTVKVWGAFDKSYRGKVKHYDVEAPHQEFHYLAKSWEQKSFENLLTSFSGDSVQLLIQYRPKAFPGAAKAQLCKFLKRLPSSVKVHVILHRSFERPVSSSSYRAFFLAPLWQLFTLYRLISLAQHVYVTSSKTLTLWHRLFAGKKRLTHLPVPSHISVVADPEKVRNLRLAFAPKHYVIIGTFSSFAEPEVLDVLRQTLALLLKKHSNWIWLAFGRYSRGFVQFMQGSYRDLADRLQYGGELDPLALSAHLQICDLALQPYYLGVSTLRTSAMAPLSHELPLVSSWGKHTEALWHESGCAHLVKWNKVKGYSEAVEYLIQNPLERKKLALRGRETYQKYFSLEKNLEALQGVEG